MEPGVLKLMFPIYPDYVGTILGRRPIVRVAPATRGPE
jgi:hypothetical protein